jgi:hypothetical protein
MTTHPLLVPRSKNRVQLYLSSLRVFVAYEKGETYNYLTRPPFAQHRLE